MKFFQLINLISSLDIHFKKKDMKKGNFIFSMVVILLMGFNPSSNTFKFTIGQATKTGRITGSIIGKFGDNILILSRTNRGLWFNKMKGTKFIKSAKLNLKYKKKKMFYRGTFIKNKKLYILSSFYNSKAHKDYYFYKEFDVKSMKEMGDLVLIEDVPIKSKARLGNIFVAHSNDSTKTLLMLVHPDKGKKKQEIIFVVLNKDMSVLWKKKSYLKYLDKEFKITSKSVDNKGNVYIAGKKYFKKSSRKSVPYKYHIVIFNKDADDFNDIEINLKKYYINDMVLTIADNGDIVFAGFYSPDKSWTVDGSFYLRLDGKTHEAISDNYKEFTSSFITKGFSERTKKKAKRKEKKGKNIQFYKYDLSDMVMRTDGGIILIAEQYYVVVYTTTSVNGAMYTHYEYYYNDIIIVNIDNKGNIVWNSKISKFQSSGTTSHLSYIMGVYNNNLYFVINDNPKNRLIKESSHHRDYGGGRNADLVAFTVNPAGKVNKEFVKNTKPFKFLMCPKMSYFDTENGAFYLTGWYPRKTLNLAEIKIE